MISPGLAYFIVKRDTGLFERRYKKAGHDVL
ncbi:hypothetical protein DFQ00_13217 [Paenibacillus barcinonensis]|uniref:Uncharacterized protein n=1 Tax=Paenibacillus barcinonensis TaxID=198119 RepID=A0A2V4V9X0_PAEBA|nr:hypothetical protein DFQ00_13217 [Paenibacillus barcinonensis]